MAQWLSSKQYGDGSDGAYAPSTGTDAPIDSSCSGASGGTELSATNASFAANQIILIHQSRGTGVGQWEVNVIDSYTAGTITTKNNLAYTYTDSGASQAQVLVLKQYSSALIDAGVTLTGKAWDGNVGGILAFLCNGTTTITGDITGYQKGYVGGGQVKNTYGRQGEGTIGAGGTQARAANGSGGGGTDNNLGGGGGGGHGGVGVSGGGDGYGYGGGTSGATDLATMTLGGSGGSGGSGDVANYGGRGGHGGGLVLILTNDLAEITGGISVNGANGSAGESANTAGGGGGAGGSVLIKCNTAILGTSKITSIAGTGGASGGGSYGAGGAGGVGRVAIHYGTSYTGESNPAANFTLDTDLILTSSASQAVWF